MPLLQTLYAAEGRPDVLGTQHIPQGHAPGDAEITEEEAKEIEAFHQSQQQPQQPLHAQTSVQPSTDSPLQPQMQAHPEKQPQEKEQPEILKQDQAPAPTTLSINTESVVSSTTSGTATTRRNLPPLPSSAEPPPYIDTAGHGVPHEKHT